MELAREGLVRTGRKEKRAHLLSGLYAAISVHTKGVLVPEGALFEEVDLKERESRGSGREEGGRR